MNVVAEKLRLTLHASLDEGTGGNDGVHAWLCDVDEVRAGLFSQSYDKFWEERLSADELARAARFKSPHDRARFVSSRVILRSLLARWLDVEPNELGFDRDALGKPRLISPAAEIPLHFSCSHSRGLFLVAVGPSELGVDVELVRNDFDVLAVADANFLASEAAQLRSLAGRARTIAFHRLWTAKEAFGKALGCGVAPALKNVEFALDFNGVPKLASVRDRFASGLDWQLLQQTVTLGSVQAVVAVTTQLCHENTSRLRRSLSPSLVAPPLARC